MVKSKRKPKTTTKKSKKVAAEPKKRGRPRKLDKLKSSMRRGRPKKQKPSFPGVEPNMPPPELPPETGV